MKNTSLSIERIRQELIEIEKRFCGFSLLEGYPNEEKGVQSCRSLCLLATDNSAESICLYCFLIKKKIPFLLVDAGTSTEHLQEIIHNFQPAYLFIPEEEGAISPSLDYVREFIYGHYLCQKNMKKNVWQRRDVASEVAVLLSTSGSTGNGKFVTLSYENLESNADAIIQSLEMKEGDRAAVMLPISYSYGLSVVNSTLKAGGTLLIPEGTLIQKSFWDFLEAEKVNIIYGVPYTYEVFRKLRIWRRPLKDLRIMTQAGGALPREMKEFLLGVVEERKEKGQNVDLAVMYGQTEATARMSCFFLNRHLQEIDSVGKAVPGGRFSIEKPDEDGQGDIVYEGKNVSLGYALSWKDLTSEAMCQKWDRNRLCMNGNERILYTGDIGRLDEDGFLYITGRKSRFIKLRGYRISLDELQGELQKILGLNVVCVSGVDKTLEKVGILLEKPELQWAKRNTNKEESIGGKHIQKLVEGFLAKRRIQKNEYTVTFVEEIPRKNNGKVDYQQARRFVTERKETDGISAES